MTRSLIFIAYLGTWLELLKDKLIFQKEIVKEFLSESILTSWIYIIFKGFNQLIKVTVTYLDLTTGADIKDIGNFWEKG